MVAIGDIIRVTSWTHPDGPLTTVDIRDKKLVVVVALLGYEPKDGSAPLDVKAAMRQLKWVPANKKLRKRSA